MLHVLSNVHTALLQEQINWAAHVKVTSWVLKRVMLQFVTAVCAV